MIDGSCHCGAVQYRFDGMPDSATVCNCTICQRYAGLWVYDFENERIQVSGPTKLYTWGHRTIAYHSCDVCGCVAYWRAMSLGKDGRRRIAVNLRLANPEAVANIVIDHFDGLKTFEHLPRDGRCVKDLMF